ncbi:MAG: hemerythrin family protein, partial [Cyanobacteria bacterium P01_A01_bin.135]
RTMLKEFEACALEHFALEEELMLAQEYQNYELHCGIHRNLIRKVSSTLEKLESDDYEFSTEVPKVLSDWMIHHIRGEDRQMIAFLQEQTCLGQLA